MRNGLIALWMLLCAVTPAAAQVGVDIGFPGVNIGINVPVYPQLVLVPGYPVYYAPQTDSNYFYYDGSYWVYQNDNWYTSSWYNGPWELVSPDAVPLFILRIPVRYYRHPPDYFRRWRSDAPPRWDEHWGNAWARNRSGWDNWNHSSAPPPAPLPAYQRQYSGNRYPSVQQQRVLQSQNYHYQPHDAVVQQHYQAPRAQGQPAASAAGNPSAPQARYSPQPTDRGFSRPSPVQQGAALAPHGQSSQKGSPEMQKSANVPPPSRQAVQSTGHQVQEPQRSLAQHEQRAPRMRGQDNAPPSKTPAQEPKHAQGQQPTVAAAQHEQQAPRSQGEEKAPQGKAGAGS